MSKYNSKNTIHILGSSFATKNNSMFIIYQYISKCFKQNVNKDLYIVKDKFFELPAILFSSSSFFVKTGYFIKYFLHLIFYIFFKIKRKDILIVTLNSGILFRIVALLKNRKILVAHDNFEIERSLGKKGENKKVHSIKKFLLFFGLYYSYKQYAYIVCISNYTRLVLLKFLPQISKSRIINMNCSIDTKIFKKKKYTKPLFRDKYILYVGTEEKRKNIITILKTFQILRKTIPNLKLYKVGKELVPKHRQITLSMLRDLNLQFGNEIILFEEIERDFLVDLYNHAELLLFPSLKEGFGFPIAEAMACGCPVVTSNRSPMQDLVENKNLVANPEDADALANICQKIIKNKNFKNCISKELLEKSKNYSWEKVANNIYDIVNQL